MPLIKEIEARSILSKSGLPGVDFVINPYHGCSHSCIYCYVQNMPNVSDPERPWGSYIDVKINAPNLIPFRLAPYYGRSIYLSSVTDPYQPIELKYQLTRRILEKLVIAQPDLTIQTKSAFVLRDLDLLLQYKKRTVGFTIVTLDENVRRLLEPGASPIPKRYGALKLLNSQKIETYVFIGPIFPYLTDWAEIVRATREFVDYYYFDWINIKGILWSKIINWIKRYFPDLEKEYVKIYQSPDLYWSKVKEQIEKFCRSEKIKGYICF